MLILKEIGYTGTTGPEDNELPKQVFTLNNIKNVRQIFIDNRKIKLYEVASLKTSKQDSLFMRKVFFKFTHTTTKPSALIWLYEL